MTDGPRHVTLNALFFEPDRSGGTETYLRGLVPALAQEFPKLGLTLVTTRLGAARLVSDGWRELCEIVQMPADEGQRLQRLGVEQAGLPLVGRRRRTDLVHSLASVAPVRPGLPSVITVHDMTFFHYRTFNAVTTFGMRQIVSRAARRADALLTGSDVARADICATLGIDPSRVLVVPHGPGQDTPVTPVSAADLAGRLRLPQRSRLLLCLAALRPHKNQAALVRALPRLPDDTVLVLAGHRESYAHEVQALATELGVADRLRIPGYVEAPLLEAMWRAAACAVFPTRAEGFGLPVVEAMRRGVPVACSDIAILREVGGDVPRYFDPDDPAGIAQAIDGLLTAPADPGHGLARAQGFSWAAAAHGTYEGYERALGVTRAAVSSPPRG
ncbi:MAG: glycosyltransferase family 4 protein [Actinomycetota bacterium]|nr:glycosyltransferase family 4 protein [Actinomycetota bacterium]